VLKPSQDFKAKARTSIDRHVGRDQLTIRPTVAKGAEKLKDLLRATVTQGADAPMLAAPSTLLSVLP
jgi:hypothetical protein